MDLKKLWRLRSGRVVGCEYRGRSALQRDTGVLLRPWSIGRLHHRWGRQKYVWLSSTML